MPGINPAGTRQYLIPQSMRAGSGGITRTAISTPNRSTVTPGWHEAAQEMRTPNGHDDA